MKMTIRKTEHEVSCPVGHKFKTKATAAARCPVCKKDFRIKGQIKRKIKGKAAAVPRDTPKPAPTAAPEESAGPMDLLSIPQDIPEAQPAPQVEVPAEGEAPAVPATGQTAPPPSSAALGRYFKTIALAAKEGFKGELSDDTMGEVIGCTMELCGGMFNLQQPAPEEQLVITPLHIIGISAAVIAAPYVLPMIKARFGKKKDEKDEDDGA